MTAVAADRAPHRRGARSPQVVAPRAVHEPALAEAAPAHGPPAIGALARSCRRGVTVNGKNVQAVRNGATVNLRNLPKSRYTVVISLRLADGGRVRDVRRYRTCARKIERELAPLRTRPPGKG